MNKVPDRAKLRREYLWKKTTSNLQMLVGIALLLVGGPLALFFLAVLLVAVVLCRNDMDLLWHVGRLQIMLYASGFLLMGALSYTGHKTCLFAAKKSVGLAYVPPVDEQIATLPVNEVLLRASQVSAASPEELLRPAGRQETNAKELLRRCAGKP